MTGIDNTLSAFIEAPDDGEFTASEKDHLRILLRRLRFLEKNLRTTPDDARGRQFIEREALALEFSLGPQGLGFIERKAQ